MLKTTENDRKNDLKRPQTTVCVRFMRNAHKETGGIKYGILHFCKLTCKNDRSFNWAISPYCVLFYFNQQNIKASF